MNTEPIVIPLKESNAILHESGIYFFSKNKDLTDELKSISGKRRQEIDVPKNERDRLAKVVIFLSTDCNLRCIYCYASSGMNHKVVSVEKAKVLIDFIASKCDRLILDFHGGGEPLMHFDIIKEIYDYAKATGKLYRTVLISNGVIEKNRDEILQWIIEHVDNMAISCDGYREIQGIQRPSVNSLKNSSSEVESTIKFFVDNNYTFTVRSTITAFSAPKLEEITKYFAELGVKYIVFAPCYNYGRSNSKKLIPNPVVYGENYLKAIEYAAKNQVRITSNSFRFPGYHYCGALSGFNIALTVDGDISTCYEVTENNEDVASQIFIVGKVMNDRVIFENEKVSKLIQMENTPDLKCFCCPYRLVCRGGCPVKKIRNSDDSLNNLCGITKYLVPRILEFLNIHPEASEYILKGVKYETTD